MWLLFTRRLSHLLSDAFGLLISLDEIMKLLSYCWVRINSSLGLTGLGGMREWCEYGRRLVWICYDDDLGAMCNDCGDVLSGLYFTHFPEPNQSVGRLTVWTLMNAVETLRGDVGTFSVKVHIRLEMCFPAHFLNNILPPSYPYPASV